jgi:hypothetical protein
LERIRDEMRYNNPKGGKKQTKNRKTSTSVTLWNIPGLRLLPEDLLNFSFVYFTTLILNCMTSNSSMTGK